MDDTTKLQRAELLSQALIQQRDEVNSQLLTQIAMLRVELTLVQSKVTELEAAKQEQKQAKVAKPKA